jgi:signal transduction histidine kinase
LLTEDLGIAITSEVVWSVDNLASTVEPTDWPVWQRRLDLPGSAWVLTVEPTAAAMETLVPQVSWSTLFAGTGRTLLLAGYLHLSRSRRREHREIAQLQQLSADKDRFLAAVSHELRTPLTVVIGLATELADNDNFDIAERRELLALVAEHGHEAGAIVEDLLVAARSDIDRISVRPEKVDLFASIKLAISASPFDDLPIAGDSPPVLADPARLQQILRNLLVNASRYGGPTVEIRVASDGVVTSITVADDGQPISLPEQESIFDPYTTAHDHDDHVGSIGLGLFISKKLARLMNGDLTYEHDGAHSIFQVVLPCAKEPAPAQ